jgi:hypothetical protein
MYHQSRPTTNQKEAPVKKHMYARTMGVLVLSTCLVVVTLGCAAPKRGSKDAERDYSTTRLSERGVYKVTFLSLADPVPVGKVHAWRLHVEDPKGSAVTNASITVDGAMPEHGHGLPTRPRVTQDLGSGDYLVEGLKFQMRGWWVVRFSVSAAGASDTVTFNLQL